MKRYMILASAMLLAACGSDDKDSTGPGGGSNNAGAFSVTVGGDAEGSLSGFAVHASVPQSSQQDGGFAMALNDTTAETGGVVGSLIIGKVNPGLPSVGNHGIADLEQAGDNDLFAIGIITDEDGASWICASTGGSINVQTSSTSRLKGSMSVQATCQETTSETTADVTFTGSYDSRGGTVTAPMGLRAQRGAR